MDHLLLIYTTIGTGIAVIASIIFFTLRFRLNFKVFSKEVNFKSFAQEMHDEIVAFTNEVKGWKEELRKNREERNRVK